MGAGLARRLLRPHCSHARLEDRKAGAWRGAAAPWKHTVDLYPTATSRRYLGKAMTALRPHRHLLTSERTRLTTTHPSASEVLPAPHPRDARFWE